MSLRHRLAQTEIVENVLVLSINAPPVNALGRDVRQAIQDAVAEAAGNPDILALVIRGEGRTFSAGADIREFGQPPAAPYLPDLVDRVEASRKPVVAAIHGTALGGGLELALGCHFRIAAATARVGLPETKLGLIPGAGGTQRLPRVVGVLPALEMMTAGAMIAALPALKMGLLDEVVAEPELQTAAIALALEAAAGQRKFIRTRDRGTEFASAFCDAALFEDFATANARKFRHLEAPQAVIKAVRFACGRPFDEGIANERAIFMSLLEGQQSKALRYAFFAERDAAKIPDFDANVTPLPIQTIGVVGAGTMGTGITLNFLLAGIPVTLVEADADALERGRKTISQTIERSVAAKRMAGRDAERAFALLNCSLAYHDLGDADLIIEAAFETMAVKQEVFRKLDRYAKDDAILATNTSYLDVDVIAGETSRPDSVLGLHFFAPANIMRLLEVVRGARTSDAVLATALKLAKKINKVAVVAGVAEGFIGNRMLAVRQSEAERIMLEGAGPYRIDAIVEAFGLPMGPFRMADLAGLDLGWNRAASAGATIRETMCEHDRRGQKNGAGFYDYPEGGKAEPSAFAQALITQFAKSHKIKRADSSDEQILQRLVYPMINEGARILDEGKAYRASDIDVVWLNGYGWPNWRGGPMHYADSIGLREIRDALLAMAAKYGNKFEPCALLNRLADNGSSFAAYDAARSAGRW